VTTIFPRKLVPYAPVVMMCTTRPQIKITIFCSHDVFMCLVWLSKEAAIISLSNISW